ncbi:DUF2231 domain-containing protein, partial [Cupriavidus oxalaticus]
ARHPIHPMLVALPIGLWILSFEKQRRCTAGM